MPDIVGLILADHARIREMFRALENAASASGEPGSDGLGQLWTVLAGLLAFHVDAENEICCPAVFAGVAHGQLAEITADDDDIREAMGEARFQPAGSRSWRLAVRAAQAAATRHIELIEAGPLPAFRAVSARQREVPGAWASAARPCTPRPRPGSAPSPKRCVMSCAAPACASPTWSPAWPTPRSSPAAARPTPGPGRGPYRPSGWPASPATLSCAVARTSTSRLDAAAGVVRVTAPSLYRGLAVRFG